MSAQRRLQADSLIDVAALATCVLTTPETQHPVLLAVVHDLGLMRFKWPYSPLIWLVHKTKGRAGLRAFFAMVQERSPADVAAFVEQTARHIVQGTDREDPRSVGGFSQREIDALQASVSFSALEPAR